MPEKEAALNELKIMHLKMMMMEDTINFITKIHDICQEADIDEPTATIYILADLLEAAVAAAYKAGTGFDLVGWAKFTVKQYGIDLNKFKKGE